MGGSKLSKCKNQALQKAIPGQYKTTLKTIKMKSKKELLAEQNDTEKNDIKEEENITSYIQVDDTPFIVIKDNDKWKIIFGQSVASNNFFDTKEEAIRYIKRKPWDLILISASIYNEMVQQLKNENNK